MFRKILLPVDLSDRHGQAVQIASELARPGGGEVTLLHVIEVIPGLSMEEEKDFYLRLEKKARKHLTQLAAHFERDKVPCRAEVVYGSRGPDIVRHAKEAGADLIVLTAPRIDPAHPTTGWGSLSYKLSVLAPCPVLLVK